MAMPEARPIMSTWAHGRLARLLYVAHRVLERASGDRAGLLPYLLVAQPIGRRHHVALRDDPSTRIFELKTPHDILTALPRPGDVLHCRFAQGARCHAATVKGEFAGCIWVARRKYDEDEVRCRFVLAQPESSAWDFDVYVTPAYRTGRVLGRLWKAVDASLAHERVAWTFSRISLFNQPSITSHERLGAEPVGIALFLVLGSLQLALFTQSPYVHVCVGGTGPTLRLNPPAESAIGSTA